MFQQQLILSPLNQFNIYINRYIPQGKAVAIDINKINAPVVVGNRNKIANLFYIGIEVIIQITYW